MKLFGGELTNKKRDFSLDLLRALSCIMVMGVHIGQRFSIPGALGRFFEKGSTGVSFFFILSGYLAFVSMDRIYEKDGISFKGTLKFWVRRSLHVLPLYYLLMLFYFIFYLAIKGIPGDETGLYWIRYIFMINLWVPAEDVFWTNLGAVWSISAFMLFYLLAPLFYALIRKYWVAWIGVLGFYGVFKLTDSVGTGRIPVRYMFYFLIGILVYLAIKEEKELGLAAILSFVILFCFLAGGGTALITPFLAALYIIACKGKTLSVRKDSIMVTLVTFISTISYSIYLVHAGVLAVLDRVGITSAFTYIPIFAVLTLILSYITYNLVEVKFARWLEGGIFDRLGL
ncbi:acyltransferase family protein [Butyrivibrio sp. FCS006]|uniref:acyltransferase family protein n=1 Tax=Butyrivibrio sp. FCS006 TaxID=1280684 RepID=UPI000403A642|nr:acyltransferase [Butyrivibrio sp. FCS006]